MDHLIQQRHFFTKTHSQGQKDTEVKLLRLRESGVNQNRLLCVSVGILHLNEEGEYKKRVSTETFFTKTHSQGQKDTEVKLLFNTNWASLLRQALEQILDQVQTSVNFTDTCRLEQKKLTVKNSLPYYNVVMVTNIQCYKLHNSKCRLFHLTETFRENAGVRM